MDYDWIPAAVYLALDAGQRGGEWEAVEESDQNPTMEKIRCCFYNTGENKIRLFSDFLNK